MTHGKGLIMVMHLEKINTVISQEKYHSVLLCRNCSPQKNALSKELAVYRLWRNK